MKRLPFLIVLVFVASFPVLLWSAETPPFPNMEFRTLDGQDSVWTEDFRGQPILIAFWASWCGPCRAELPELAELTHELEDSGLVMLAVNIDSTAALGQRFLERAGIDVPAYRISNENQAAIGIQSLPTTILLDGEALPIQIFTGYSPTVVDAIRRLVKEMDAAKSGSGRESG